MRFICFIGTDLPTSHAHSAGTPVPTEGGGEARQREGRGTQVAGPGTETALPWRTRRPLGMAAGGSGGLLRQAWGSAGPLPLPCPLQPSVFSGRRMSSSPRGVLCGSYLRTRGATVDTEAGTLGSSGPRDRPTICHNGGGPWFLGTLTVSLQRALRSAVLEAEGSLDSRCVTSWGLLTLSLHHLGSTHSGVTHGDAVARRRGTACPQGSECCCGRRWPSLLSSSPDSGFLRAGAISNQLHISPLPSPLLLPSVSSSRPRQRVRERKSWLHP